MSFDHLNLAKDDKVRKILQKHADGIYDEIILYSNYVTKINRKSKSQQRILIITNAAIYNFTPGAAKSRSFSIRGLFESNSAENKNDFQPPQVTKSKTMPHSKTASMTGLKRNSMTGSTVGQLKRRIAIKNIHTISLSAIVHEVVLHVPNEYDYLYRVAQKKDVEHIVRVLQESAGNLTPHHHIKCWIFELNNLAQISENDKARIKKNQTQEQYMQNKLNDWNKKYKMKKYQPKNLQTNTNKKGHIKAHSTMNPQRFGNSQQPQYFNNYPSRPLTPNFTKTRPSINQNQNQQQPSYYTPPPNQQSNNMNGFPDTKQMQFQFPPPNTQPPPNNTQPPPNTHRNVYSENFANNAQYQNQMAIMYQQQGSRGNLNQSMTNFATMQYQNNQQQPQQPQGYNQYNNNNNNNNQYNQRQQQKTKKKKKRKRKRTVKRKKTESSSSESSSRSRSSSRSSSNSYSRSSYTSSSGSGSYSDDGDTNDVGPTPSPQPSQSQQSSQSNNYNYNNGQRYHPQHQSMHLQASNTRLTPTNQSPEHRPLNSNSFKKGFNRNAKNSLSSNGKFANNRFVQQNTNNAGNNINNHTNNYNHINNNNNNNNNNTNNNGRKQHHYAQSTQLPATNKFPLNKQMPNKALPTMPNKPIPQFNGNNNGINGNHGGTKYNIRPKNSNNYNNNNNNNNYNQMNQNNGNKNGNNRNIKLVSSILEAKELPVNNKEAYLPDHLFWEVFKMTKDQFYAQRPWKQKQLKRNTGFW